METTSKKTRSHSSTSTRSSACSTSSAAAAARAKAEAARARLKYNEKETRMRMEKVELEAKMEKLAIEKEIAVATAMAETLEAAAAISERSYKLPLEASPVMSAQRTQDYVNEQAKVCEERSLAHEEDLLFQHESKGPYTKPYAGQSAYDPRFNTESIFPPAANVNANDFSLQTPNKREPQNPFLMSDGAQHSQPLHSVTFENKRHLSSYHRPQSQPIFRSSYNNSDAGSFHPHSYTLQPTQATDPHMTDFVRFLARRELVTTGLLQFNDQPESYKAWRSSFLNAVRGLDLTCSEEMDLLVKWLGKESAEHAKRIRSVHISHPAAGLKMIWNRLDECYGSAEVIEKALFQRLDSFPRISNKDFSKLRDLSDLLMELDVARVAGDLPGLSYLDTARGVNPIVQKLPYGLQEKWLSYGSSYKQHHQVAFPPFSVFAAFLHQQAQIRNDPSFMLTDQMDYNKVDKPPWRASRSKEISVHKTEVSQGAYSNQDRKAKTLDDPDKICPVHNKPHSLLKCRTFRTKPMEERKNFLKGNGICFKCCISTSHTAKECQCTVKCAECDSCLHPSALHPGPPPWVKEMHPTTEHGGEPDSAHQPKVSNQCTQICGRDLTDRSCSKILLAKVYPEEHRDKVLTIYVILDEQSNRSLARSDFFDAFHMQSPTSSYTLKTCSGVSERTGRTASGFYIESLDGKTVQRLPRLLECNEIPDDRAEIPTPSAASFHPHLKPIAHLIPELEPDVPIMLLLGRDIIRLHKVRKHVNGPPDAPYAQKLDLGWVVMGNVCLGNAHKPLCVNTLFTNALEGNRPTLFKPCPGILNVKERYCSESDAFLKETLSCERDGLGRKVFQLTGDDNKIAPSIDDLTFMAIMKEGLKKDDHNSWVAPLPFKRPRQRLPDNKSQALNRFSSLKRSLQKKPEMSEHFFSFMGEIFKNGHAEVAPPLKANEEHWYLPIFGVYHPKKPGKIRVVFDSSAQYCGVCLNDVLLTGPDLNNTLLGVLIRFRREAVAATADIKQMFHCFLVREQDRNFLRFLWFRDNNPAQDVIEYRMTVHVFGNSPSPAVAIHCLRQSVNVEEQNCNHEVAQFVKRDFYIDDGLKSLPTAEGIISLLKGTQDILANSNLKLNKIASNSKEVMDAFPPQDRAEDLKDLDLGLDTPPVQRSLGLKWDVKADRIQFKVDIEEKPFTRRGVLSVVNGVYDPLGFIAPVTIQGKHILRELTQEKGDWDSPLPEEMLDQWASWRDSLKDLKDLHILRPYTKASPSEAKRRELNVFSDASTKAIAAVAYLTVTEENGNSHTGFIMGKAKLSPRPEHSVPRLELCAAVLAVELADLIVSEIDLHIDATTFYTDSKVVLGYICNETRRFYVYVNNRVIRIRRSSHPQQWRYIPTDQNPADCATRSITPARLSETTWLTGPALLKQASGGSFDTFELVNPNTDAEVRPQISTLNTRAAVQQLGSQRFSRFSSWQSLNRALCNISHIAHSYHSNPDNRSGSCRGWHLCQKAHTVEQLSQSTCIIIRAVQEEAYAEELACLKQGVKIPHNSVLKTLDPFIDKLNCLRVGGRIREGVFEVGEKNPLIIPGKHHVATLLIRYYHEQTSHQGRLFTEGAIRTAGYWITGVKRLVSSSINHCVTCRKLRGSPETQKMADLPADRLSMEPPFTNVGCDVFGPWDVVARRTRGGLAHSKRWAVIFTCMAVRAVHIEVIESLDTSSFINALRRFLAVRGPVKQIRSDRGTNFVGASAELKIPSNIDSSSVKRYLAEQGCSWLFNPPHAPHMGGSWERMIGIAKRILDSMFLQLGTSQLTHEVLTTLMAEVAAIINARPLASVSTDPDDPVILTPATLLTQKVSVPSAPSDDPGTKDLFKRQWRQVQHLAQTFWSRWRKHYLSSLQPRRKWQSTQPNLEPGSIVLLKDQQLKRNEWPLGIVTQVFPSKDNSVRKAEIKVSRHDGTKLYQRPLSELILLLPAS